MGYWHRAVTTVVVSLIFISTALADSPISARPGQLVVVGHVYWIKDCQSILKRVVSADAVTGGEYVSLSVQPQTVRTRQCGNDVPGAVVFATPKPIATPAAVHLEFVVHYDTNDGPKVSAHTRDLTITP